MSDKIKINKEEVVKLLQKLIQIKSPYFEEDEIIEYASQWLTEKGVNNYIQNYHEEKITNYKGKNVISILDSGKEGPTIYFNGHLDTVQLCNGWDYDPYGGEIVDDRIYGVGALDMKSGCAAIMEALRTFVKNNDDFKGKIISTLVSDEEGPYGLGTDAVINAGLTENIDVSIVTEPSAGFTKGIFPNICLGARGGYGLIVEFFGKSAHAANPQEGINAATEASKLVSNLDKTKFIKDEHLGEGSICVVSVEADGGACSVPDYAKVQIFRHIVPGETKDSVINDIERICEEVGVNCEYEIKARPAPNESTEAFLPYKVSQDNTYVKSLNAVCSHVTGKDASITYFQSIGDFCYLGTRVDAPCIIFGTEGENYHGKNEYTTLSSLTETTQIIYDYLVELLVN